MEQSAHAIHERSIADEEDG